MLLSGLCAEKITRDIEDADLEEGSGNTFSGQCFKWTLFNVQEAGAKPAACRSAALLFYTPHTHTSNKNDFKFMVENRGLDTILVHFESERVRI